LVVKIGQLILYKDIIVVYSQIHTKYINKQCGQKVKLLNVKPGGTYKVRPKSLVNGTRKKKKRIQTN
jgi:hypothetical protein